MGERGGINVNIYNGEVLYDENCLEECDNHLLACACISVK